MDALLHKYIPISTASAEVNEIREICDTYQQDLLHNWNERIWLLAPADKNPWRWRWESPPVRSHDSLGARDDVSPGRFWH